MATYYLAPDPCQSTFLIPGSNTPGSGVQVFTYATGTSTKVSVAKDSTGSALHTNPIVLDSGGNLPSASNMYIEAGVEIDVVYAPSGDSDPPASAYITISNVQGVPPAGASSTQWVPLSTPTFVNTNAFRVVGDQTTEVQVGRRVRTTNTGGTVYSRVTSATFATSTTVGVVNDSGSLDSGLSTAAYGLLAATNPSTPLLTDFYPTVRSSTAVFTQHQNVQAYTSSHVITWPDSDITPLGATSTSVLGVIVSSGTTGMSFQATGGGTINMSSNASTLSYYRIGNICHIFGNLIVQSTSGTVAGSLRLHGLPFSTAAMTNSTRALIAIDGFTSTMAQFNNAAFCALWLSPTTTSGLIRVSNGNSTQDIATQLTSGEIFYINSVYPCV